jgi:hypothetical protein
MEAGDLIKPKDIGPHAGHYGIVIDVIQLVAPGTVYNCYVFVDGEWCEFPYLEDEIELINQGE